MLGARSRKQAFALSEFPRGLFFPSDPLALLPHPFLRWFFISSPPLNFTEEPFALKLPLQDPEGLFDIVIANEDFQGGTPLKLQDRG